MNERKLPSYLISVLLSVKRGILAASMMPFICPLESFLFASNIPQWNLMVLLSSSLLHLEFNAISTEMLCPRFERTASLLISSGGSLDGRLNISSNLYQIRLIIDSSMMKRPRPPTTKAIMHLSSTRRFMNMPLYLLKSSGKATIVHYHPAVLAIRYLKEANR
jgi:hypothetical protein